MYTKNNFFIVKDKRTYFHLEKVFILWLIFSIFMIQQYKNSSIYCMTVLICILSVFILGCLSQRHKNETPANCFIAIYLVVITI